MKQTAYFELMKRMTDPVAIAIKPLPEIGKFSQEFRLYLPIVKSTLVTMPLTSKNTQGTILVHNTADYRKKIRSLQILPATKNIMDIFIEGGDFKCSLIL